MAKQALIEQRPWLLASITAATAFYFLSDNPVFEGTWGLLAKGASVGLLALYVLLRLPHGRRGLDGALVVAMLVLAAAGDVAIELDFVIGGAFFAAAHCVSAGLYLRNLHKRPSPTQKMTGAALLLGTPLISYLLSGQGQIALYASFLGAMASAAWMSHYPRYRVGTGAVLFLPAAPLWAGMAAVAGGALLAMRLPWRLRLLALPLLLPVFWWQPARPAVGQQMLLMHPLMALMHPPLHPLMALMHPLEARPLRLLHPQAAHPLRLQHQLAAHPLRLQHLVLLRL